MFSRRTNQTKRRAAKQAEEEKVSLLGTKPSGSRFFHNSRGSNSKANTTTPKGKSHRNGRFAKVLPETWNVTRLMRYLSLTAVSAMVTFFILGKEAKVMHWEEYHHLLEPQAKASQRCYTEGRHHQNERCTCPAPSVPLALPDETWKAQHKRMITAAKQAPKQLDIVFLGDAIVERWNGTKAMGTQELPGIRGAWESHFTKAGGGHFEGLALGSSNDTGPNLLWHIENGLLNTLDPKVWFISVGTNDLYEEKCTDKFVVANVLNVIKAIHTQKPESRFIVHGILPRKDNPKSKSPFLTKKWKNAQAINTKIRKFTEKSGRLYYMQAGGLFLSATHIKARNGVDETLLEDGMYPTRAGLDKWGDHIVKTLKKIFHDIEKQKLKDVEKQSRRTMRGSPNAAEVISNTTDA